MTHQSDLLPFSAVVGQQQAKLALLLSAIERRIGGVLLRGDKGSAKSTLARGLASLLPGSASFVELPIGATEDRVVGTLDLRAALTGGEVRFEPGLLAAADGGVLYVDEINLLPDHLVDLLLDVATSGVNRVEREGVSHVHSSRFLLVGSMNPEEGELRPQLLDRFGLAVEVRTPADPGERAAAVRRRLEFDASPGEVRAEWAATESGLVVRLERVSPAPVPVDLVDAVAALCASVGAEGLRADLTVCRAAGALAGWEGRDAATAGDARRVAPMALAHRGRRDPFDPAGMDGEKLADAMDRHLGPVGGDGADGEAGEPGEPGGAGDPGEPGGAGEWPGSGERPGGGEPVGGEPGGGEPGGSRDSGGAGRAGGKDGSALAEGPFDHRPPREPGSSGPGASDAAGGERSAGSSPAAGRPAHPKVPVPDVASALAGLAPPGTARDRRQGASAPGRRSPAEGRRGRLVGDRAPQGAIGSVAVGATLRRALSRDGSPDPSAGGSLIQPEDLREAIREQKSANLIVLAVDASSSMGAEQRLAAAKGAVLSLLRDAYQRRDLVALVGFRGDRAEVLLRPTGSVEVARARLADLPTGGRTPLAAGILEAMHLATAPARAGSHRPCVVVVTDGRATSALAGGDPFEEAAAAADEVRRQGVAGVVIDVEGAGGAPGSPRLGLAGRLAARMGARHVRVDRLTAAAVENAVLGSLPAGRKEGIFP